MTKKNLLEKVREGIVETKGLIWLGKRTERYTEKLNLVFVSVDLELTKNPVDGLLDAYGLSGYFGMVENADTILIGVSRELLCNANLSKIVENIPKEILEIQDPDRSVRYTSVSMWATRSSGIDFIANNVNVYKNYNEFLTNLYTSGSLKKGNMISLVILHQTFVNYVLADNNFVAGVKNNPFGYWNIKKMMDFINQQHVALFNDLVAGIKN